MKIYHSFFFFKVLLWFGLFSSGEKNSEIKQFII